MAGLIIPLLIFGALWLLVVPWPLLRKRRWERGPAGTPHRFRVMKRQQSDTGAGRTGAASGSVGVSAPDTALMLDLLGAMIQSGTSLPAAVATLAQVAESGSRERLDKVASALQLEQSGTRPGGSSAGTPGWTRYRRRCGSEQPPARPLRPFCMRRRTSCAAAAGRKPSGVRPP